MPDLLVTGTDTGVGKTVVASALLIGLRQRGARAVGFKPVESGIGADEIADSELLARACERDEPRARPLLRLEEPLAPALAAERAGLALDGASVEQRIRELRAAGYTLVVEGAGGLLVPLAWGFTALDLAARAGLEAIVVARPGLGTLNQILLTAAQLERGGVRLRGVVLNGRAAVPDLAEQTNPAVLARLLPGVPIVVTPRLTGDSLAVAHAVTPTLARLTD